MSRRRLQHGKAARELIPIKNATTGQIAYYLAVRGNVAEWRNQRGIKPRGLRPKPKKDERKNAA